MYIFHAYMRHIYITADLPKKRKPTSSDASTPKTSTKKQPTSSDASTPKTSTENQPTSSDASTPKTSTEKQPTANLEDYSILSPITDEGDESIKTSDSGFEETRQWKRQEVSPKGKYLHQCLCVQLLFESKLAVIEFFI